MIGHQAIIFDRRICDTPLLHVIVQMCQWMDYYDNPVVLARSWADVEDDWSFVTGLIVEIVFDGEVEADLVFAMSLAIQKAGPKQVYLTNNEKSFAVFWKDFERTEVEFVYLWN